MNRRSVAAILVAAAVAACSGTGFQDIATPITTGAQIKFCNFAVNGPGVNFYANTQKMTAISSTNGQEAVTGVAYGGVGNSGGYSLIDPGTYTLTGKIAAATDKDLVVATLSSALADGKYYSYFASGFYNTTSKTEEAFIVEDVLPAVDFNNAYVRFVNASSNSVPQILYAKNTTTSVETALGGAVAYKAGGAFTAIPLGIYDLNTRAAGSSTNLVTRTGVSFIPGRTYTIAIRGDATLPTTGTATTRPVMDFTANR